MNFLRQPFARLRHPWTGSIRNRLILGISALLAVAMSAFVAGMVSRQVDYLHRESQEETQALAQTLAANSVSWVLASDLAGLQEVIQTVKRYPDVRYAMILARDGKVLAHTDPQLQGRYARDPVSESLLRAALAPQLLVNTSSLVDVAAPIQANGALIGWARLSLSQERVNADLRAIARSGFIYAAIGVALGILLAVVMTRGLTRDLTRLVEVTHRVRAGERGVRSGLAREDELGELGSAFDNMTTELDRASEALREREATIGKLVDKSPLAMVVVSGTEERVELVNEKFTELFGYTIEDMPDVAHWWPLAYPQEKYREEIKSKWTERVARAMESKGEIEPMEATVRCKDGALRYVEFRLASIDGRQLVTFVDLTERRRAEVAVKQSEEKFRLLTEKSVVGVYIIQDAEMVYVNPSFARTFGYSPEEIVGQLGLGDLIHPDDIDLVMNRFRERLSGKIESGNAVYKGTRKDGSLIYIETYGMVIDYRGKPAVMGSLLDITERKRAEEIIAASEKRFRDLVETASDWVWEIDENGVYTYCSPRVRDLLGYEPAELIGRSPFDLMPAAEAARVGAIFGPIVSARRPLQALENLNLRKDGREVVLETSGIPVFDADGAFNGYRGIDRDITERRRAEREALEQFKLAEAFFNNSVSALVILDRNFNFIRVNDAYAKACRKHIGEFAGRNHFEMYPSDAQAIFEEVVRSKRPFTTFTRAFVYPDQPERGTTYWDWTLAPILDQQGEVEYLVFSLNEVTERKRAENALREREEFLNSVVENIPDMIFVKDAEALRFVRFNQAGEQLLGYSREDLIGKNDYDFFPKDEADFFTTKDREVLANKRLVDIPEERIRTKDRDERILHTKKIPIVDNEGKPQYLLGISEDITERRRVEQKLLESEQRLRLHVEQTPLGVIEWDTGFRVVRWNPSAERIFGYTADEAMGRHASFIVADEAKAAVDEVWNRLLAGQGGERSTNGNVTKDGRAILCEWYNTPLIMSGGKVIGVASLVEDVTVSKQAELMRTQLAAIVQSSHDAIIGKDLNGVIISWNPGAEKVYGYRADEVVGKPVSILSPEGRKDEIPGLLERVSRGEAVMNFETERYRKDGRRIDISLDVSQIHDASGHITGASTIARDITEKKQAERALKKLNRALKALSSCNEALIHASDESQLLDRICRLIIDIEGYRMAWVGYVEHDANKTVRPVAQGGYQPGYIEHAHITWADNERGRGPLGLAIRSGQMQVVQDVTTDPRFEPWRANAARLGYGSVLVAPLSSDSEVIGALNIYAESVNAFDAAEIALLGELAADMAFGIATLRTRGAQEQSAARLQRSMEATIQAIASTVEMRDPYTAGHQRRVAELATAMAQQLGLPEDRVRGIHLAGVVHDLGKIHVPAEILSKPGKLTRIEFELIKSHPEAGYEILKGVDFPWPIAQIVYQHHERLDGSGYPRGLKAEEILLEARILAIADVVEAMASHRPYRAAVGLEPALEEIGENAGKRYDVDAAHACIALFREKAFAFKA